MNQEIVVEVVYALANEQTLITLKVPVGTTAHEAIQMCGILEQYSMAGIAHMKVGIHGKIVDLQTILRNQDRIELYRPLAADPKSARRARARRTPKI